MPTNIHENGDIIQLVHKKCKINLKKRRSKQWEKELMVSS